MTDWLSKRNKRIEEIRSRHKAYYGWTKHSEYTLAKDELLSKAPVDIDYLLGEYDVMAHVIREMRDLIRHIDMCQECADTTYKDCFCATQDLSDDVKELLADPIPELPPSDEGELLEMK